MALFAIADLHLGFSVDKSMDRFGENWVGHSEKIVENWNRVVSPEDIVLLPGDTSWAMREEEVRADLSVLQALPGRKIFLEGNHDYWWKSAAKLERQYAGMRFLKNNFDRYEEMFLCGTRGWLCPNATRFTVQDKKLYEREQMRLRLSLDSAMAQGAEEILLMMHFPPVNEGGERSAFLEIMEEYPVRQVVYGHLHGAESHKNALMGMRNGIRFELVSADFLDFCPKRIK